RKKVFSTLHRLFPQTVIPIYTLMSHSTVPFADVLKRTCLQDKIARCCGVDILIALMAGFLASKVLSKRFLRWLTGQNKESASSTIALFQEVKVVVLSKKLLQAVVG